MQNIDDTVDAIEARDTLRLALARECPALTLADPFGVHAYFVKRERYGAYACSVGMNAGKIGRIIAKV